MKNKALDLYKRTVIKEFLSDRGSMVAQKQVAIYARVSTLDKGQDPETQLLALRAYAARRGFMPAGEYVDYASGTRDDRPQYQALLAAARKRHIDVVLVWRYDRFARSTQALVQALKEFHSLGVDFISYQENIDTTTPQGEMIFTVLASLAQFESALMSDRVKAGMARARAQGKRISRAPIPRGVQVRIADLYRQEVSIHQISRKLGIGYGTAWNYVQRVRRCSTGVDLRVECSPKLVAMDEEGEHEIVQGRRLGKAYRTAHEPLNPGPQVAVLAFDGLCVLLADGMLLGVKIALVGAPAIGEKAPEAHRFQPLFALQNDRILAPPKDVRQDGATAVIHRVPQPPWLRFLPPIAPHFIQL